jgi:hypothetical protein
MKALLDPQSFFTAVVALLVLCSSPPRIMSAEDPAPVSASKTPEALAAELRPSTNVEAVISFTRQALDELRRELEQSNARNAAAITSTLSLVESSLARMHERHIESVQNSNRAVLIVSAIFAGVGFLCLILVSVVLLRAIGRFSEMAAAAPHARPLLGAGQPVAALGPGGIVMAQTTAAEEAATRFQSAIDQLQKRIVELEHSAQAVSSDSAKPRSNGNRGTSPAKPAIETAATTTVDIPPLLPDDEPAAGLPVEASSPASQASVLLGKGQALLNMDATEPALRCFDEVLLIEPNNAEALVRKGMTLEKMQDWEQALESYDRAIAADCSMTVAYLYRGGVCNRLQRYREALESYEQALQTEKKSKAS